MQQTGKYNTKRTFYLRVICLSFIICHLSLSPAGAQSFTERIQNGRAGEGVVTIHHDAAIDVLVNGRHTDATARQNTGTQRQQQQQQQQRQQTPPAQRDQQRQQQDGDERQEQQTDTLTTPRRTRRVMGWKIQAYAGTDSRRDRQQAEQVRNALRQLFPGEEVTVHFADPRWLCRMGNYATYAEAQETLAEVRRMGYPSATIVRARVRVAY